MPCHFNRCKPYKYLIDMLAICRAILMNYTCSIKLHQDDNSASTLWKHTVT